MLNLVNAVLANSEILSPLSAMKEYVVAGNGLFVRAEDSRMEACVQIAEATIRGLDEVRPFVRLKIPRVPGSYLRAILKSARAHMPNEAMYQLTFDPSEGWHCHMPTQLADGLSINYADESLAVIDLHSHNSMPAFFSETDNGDEQGFRFYCVIGKLDTATPEIACRVGVYGHHCPVSVKTIFEGVYPFAEVVETK